jgi:ATP-dependent DNA helicase RecQ
VGDTQQTNHVCPDCGSQLVLRNGRRGPFYSCPNWAKNKAKKKCLTTVDGGSENSDDEGFEKPKEKVLYQTRVDWLDGTIRRSGWKSRYVGLGASLRSIKTNTSPIFDNCWLAYSEHASYEPADADTRRVLGMFLKLLTRGDRPPLHPDSETALLNLLGYEKQLVPSRLPGDIAPRLRKKVIISAAEAVPPVPEDAGIDDFGDSDQEMQFIEWMNEEWPEAIRWVVPQPSFDQLLKSRGVQAESCRRCDFLISPPENSPFVVEIDGIQHGDQSLLDEERDAHLASIGIQTIRVSTSEMRAGKGKNLEKISDLLSEIPAASDFYLESVWSPIQTHRLLLALVEGCARGFLAGKRWVVRVEDPTGHAAELLGPYLAVLSALDKLWGQCGVAPESVTVENEGIWLTYSVDDNGTYVLTEDESDEIDLTVKLEPGLTSIHRLPLYTDEPVVIVRSAATPVQIANAPVGASQRIPMKTSAKDARESLVAVLQAVFAKQDFLPGQYEALSEVLEGRDCTVLLPTGAGKSIIYQLAGLCLPGRTLVIDPLTALIEDQLNGLRLHGIDRVVGLSSQTTRLGIGKQLLDEVSNADAYFTFISPERLKIQAFRSALREMTSLSPVNLVVVDEAHCVSEWGHDFRTAYLGLGDVVRDTCKDSAGVPPPLLALTGTASRAVLKDVLFQLGMVERTANSIVRPQTFDRKELNFQIRLTTPESSTAELKGVLKSLPGLFGESSQDFFEPNGEDTYAGLIFCPTGNGYHGIVTTSEEVKSIVPSHRIYAGKKPKSLGKINWDNTKRRNAELFKGNEITALVTTIAFGMGIDKPNIRWVVHYGLPKSIESYYQEVGRAGRDRREAHCYLILTEFDPSRNQSLLSDVSELELARETHDSVGRAAKDDVIQSMWFHLQNFQGLEKEHLTLIEVSEILNPQKMMKKVSLPFADEEDARERALHRLILLGVVGDYTTEYGSKEFTVTVNGVSADDIVQSLLAFVERTQPGRAEALSQSINREYRKLADALDSCGLALMQFVYDTIERSRRRSLREMWLAAKESAAKGVEADSELRSRILEYLAEGDLLPGIEALIDQPDFDFERWTRLFNGIVSTNDAREWRAATARLLASYPAHPGLLAGRGLAELVDVDGNFREYEFNVLQSLEEAARNYGVSNNQLAVFGEWLIGTVERRKPSAVGATLLMLDYLGIQSDGLSRIAGSLKSDSDIGLAVLQLSQELKNAEKIVVSTLSNFY